MHGGINPARKIIGGIFGAMYVSRVQCAVDCSQRGLNLLENVIGGFVPTLSLSLCINDTLIVPEKLEMNVGGPVWRKVRMRSLKPTLLAQPMLHFCTSWRVCARRMFHSCMELMYFMGLRSTRAMVWFSKFHVKLIKVGLSEKGISLDISHGILSSWTMLL